jgi:Phage shock protein B.
MVAVAEGIVALSLALCVLIIPLWLMTRIFGKNNGSRYHGGAEEDKSKIEHLLGQAEVMERRLQTLEAILDKQHPNWRSEL